MDYVPLLPHVNAVLNAVAACFLSAGFYFIRRGDRHRHRLSMIAAAVTSGLFLISYVTLRLHAPIFAFAGHGVIRPIYFTILGTHIVLAMAIVPLVVWTLLRALRADFPAHRRVARWTWPIWMYVSISGIVVYAMLYQIYAPSQTAALLIS